MDLYATAFPGVINSAGTTSGVCKLEFYMAQFTVAYINRGYDGEEAVAKAYEVLNPFAKSLEKNDVK